MENIEKYQFNFLTNVIARIDFVNEIEDLREALSDEVRNQCGCSFPIIQPQRKETRSVAILSDNGVTRVNENISTSFDWNCFGKNREKQLTISSEYLFIEYKQYNGYDLFKKDFIDAVYALSKVYRNFKIKRLGLRYINQIDLNERRVPSDWHTYWGRYIQPDLIANLYFLDFDQRKHMSRAMGNIEINFGDYFLHFQHGIYNEDYPAANRKTKYILDIDVYMDGFLDSNDLETRLDIFHEEAAKWFEQSISEELRNIMRTDINE